MGLASRAHQSASGGKWQIRLWGRSNWHKINKGFSCHLRVRLQLRDVRQLHNVQCVIIPTRKPPSLRLIRIKKRNQLLEFCLTFNPDHGPDSSEIFIRFCPPKNLKRTVRLRTINQSVWMPNVKLTQRRGGAEEQYKIG